jgi:glycosyltransferase involved in cell wall biosynthesis
MRIAHFVQRYPPALGGAEDYFARLSRHLVAGGDEVAVFTTTAIDLAYFTSPHAHHLPAGCQIEDGVEVHRHDLLHLPFQRPLLKALSFVPHCGWQAFAMPWNPLAWDTWREAGRLQRSFDLVHAAAFPYGWMLACALRLADRLQVPFLLTPFLHLGDPDDPHDRMRAAFLSPPLIRLARAARRLFVQTKGERAALLAHGIPAGRLVLQGMGVDLAPCTEGNREQARAAWGCGIADVAVGHLANNSYEKGTIDLLRAAERAWRAGGRFHVVLAGPEMPAFRRFWHHYHPLGPVQRLGRLDDQQKRDFFAGVDLFALPSRSDSFGIVLLEAWANGTPNLAYRAGGIPDVVRHGEDGILVRCGDVSSLAHELLRLTADANLRRRLGAAGRQRLGEFQWPEKLALVRKVYEEVLFEQKNEPDPPVPRCTAGSGS